MVGPLVVGVGLAVKFLQGVADGRAVVDDPHRPRAQGEQGRIDHVGDGGRVVHVATVEPDPLGVEAQVEAADIPQETARLARVVAQCVQIGAAEETLLGHVQPDDHHRPAGGEHPVGGIRIVVDVGLGIGGHITAMAVDAEGAAHHHHLLHQRDNLGRLL